MEADSYDLLVLMGPNVSPLNDLNWAKFALFVTMKAKIFQKRIGGLLIIVQSFDHLFLFSCDQSFWRKLWAIGLGGVWDGQYFFFPSHQALIHFCFLNGFFDFLDSQMYEFEYQMKRARAEMRPLPSSSSSLGDFKPIELSDEEYNAIPF